VQLAVQQPCFRIAPCTASRARREATEAASRCSGMPGMAGIVVESCSCNSAGRSGQAALCTTVKFFYEQPAHFSFPSFEGKRLLCAALLHAVVMLQAKHYILCHPLVPHACVEPTCASCLCGTHLCLMPVCHPLVPHACVPPTCASCLCGTHFLLLYVLLYCITICAGQAGQAA
jgi:hypothetical protein